MAVGKEGGIGSVPISDSDIERSAQSQLQLKCSLIHGKVSSICETGLTSYSSCMLDFHPLGKWGGVGGESREGR